MNNCAAYVGTMVHLRPAGNSAYARDRAFSLMVDIDQLRTIGSRLWLFGVDHLAPVTVASRDFCPGDGSTLRERVDAQLRQSGLEAVVGGTVRLLFFPRVLGSFRSRIGIFFCHAPDGRLGALIYDVQDSYGERHCRVEAVTTQQLETSVFVAREGRHLFEVKAPGQTLSIAVYQTSSLGRRLEARFSAERSALCDCTLLGFLLRHPLPVFGGFATTVSARLGDSWNRLAAWAAAGRRTPAPLPAARV